MRTTCRNSTRWYIDCSRSKSVWCLLSPLALLSRVYVGFGGSPSDILHCVVLVMLFVLVGGSRLRDHVPSYTCRAACYDWAV